MYNIMRSLEQVPYTIPQYPTHCVHLLHVKLQDGGVEFDTFVEIRDEQGAIFVDDGFLLQVCVPRWQYFNGACNYYHDYFCIHVLYVRHHLSHDLCHYIFAFTFAFSHMKILASSQ